MENYFEDPEAWHMRYVSSYEYKPHQLAVVIADGRIGKVESGIKYRGDINEPKSAKHISFSKKDEPDYPQDFWVYKLRFEDGTSEQFPENEIQPHKPNSLKFITE